jgi:hypothetical protein
MGEENGNGTASTNVISTAPPWLTPWKPGQSGNPSGKPAGGVGLARYIKNQTKSGQELADFMLGVMRAEERLFSKMADRITACKWLADRAFGIMDTDDERKPGTIDWSKLSESDIRFLIAVRDGLASIQDKLGRAPLPEIVVGVPQGGVASDGARPEPPVELAH